MKNLEEKQVEQSTDLENTEENCEMILEISTKGKRNSDKILKIQNKGKLNSEKI